MPIVIAPSARRISVVLAAPLTIPAVMSILPVPAPADAVVDYGDRAEHCWNGDHTRSNAYSRLRYPQMVLPWAVERMRMTAPPGADLTSWRY